MVDLLVFVEYSQHAGLGLKLESGSRDLSISVPETSHGPRLGVLGFVMAPATTQPLPSQGGSRLAKGCK